MRASLIAMAICLSIAGLSAAADVEAARRQTSIPAQGLGPALQALAKDLNFQVIYISEEIDRLHTRGASGELTPAEALAQLLNGTGFTYRYLDENTVTILPVGHDAPSRQSVLKPATIPADTLPAAPSPRQPLHLVRVETGESAASRQNEEQKKRRSTGERTATASTAENTQEVWVTGSRIRRDPAETDVSPVTVFTRQDIERSGTGSIADFVSLITQANHSPTSQEISGSPMSGRTTVNLRGLGNNTTLVLLNGRRLPKSGQGFGQDDYNLNGIPLASIERIEVLTDGASAIYGSDAIGGVVNIITRERYRGIDVMLRYGDTTRADADERAAGLSFGHNGAVLARQYSVTINLETSERGSLAASARPYTALSDYSSSGGRPLQAPGPGSTVGGAGSVATQNSFFDPTPLPGLSANRVAIPANQDGRNLTIADFIDAGPMQPAGVDTPEYRMLLSPSTNRSASLFAALDLTERAQLFMEGSHHGYRSEFQGPPPSATISVPAENPFNPFGTIVAVSKVFYELGPSLGIWKNASSRLGSGLRGGFLEDWHYELHGNYSRYVGEQRNPMPATIGFFPQYSVTPEGEFVTIHTPGSAAIAETDPERALNVFGDSRTTQPNDPALIRSLIGVDEYRETSETWTGAFQTDGVLAQLPGGALRLAFGGEYRKERVTFYKLNTTNRFWVSLDEGAERNLTATFLELRVPIVGEHQHLPGMRMLELSLAGRLDSESLFGEELTPKVGLLWRPVSSLALRTTYGLGYKVPNLQQLFTPDETFDTRFFNPIPVDPVTGDLLDDWIPVRQGGNLDLDPEHSVSWSAGLLYEPRWLPRLSLSIDYFDIDYTDKVTGSIQPQDILDFFPERVQRDPATNRVTLIDRRAINLSKAQARGVDARLVHHLNTARGTFDTRLSYTYNITNTQQTTPTSAVQEMVDTSFFPRVRANASTFWTHGGFELGPTITYESSTRNSLFGGATAPVRIRHAIVADLRGSYDFTAQGVASRWTEGLRLTMGIHNLLDRRPSATDGDGGYAKVDPRQRRYYLAVRKNF